MGVALKNNLGTILLTMPELTPEKKERDINAILLAIVIAVVLFFLILWSIVVALATKIFLGKYFKRIEAIAIAFAGFAFLLAFPGWIVGLFNWWLGRFGVNDTPWYNFPVVGLTILGLTLGFIMIAASNTKLVAWMPGRVAKYNIFSKKSSDDPLSILPTPEEKKKAGEAIVSIPLQAIATDSVRKVDSDNYGDRSFPIGIDKNGTPVTINENEINKHGLIFGSTGAGKTETIKAVAGGLLDLGWDGLILDLKEDAATGGLMEWCDEYTNYHAIPYQMFRLSDPSPKYWFSPLIGMGPDEARDTILESIKFEAAYYEALNEKQLGQLMQLVFTAHTIDPLKYPAPTVYDIGKILESPSLEKATKEMVAVVITNVPSFKKEDFNTLVTPEKPMVEAAVGLGARLTAMYETQAGRMALRGGGSRLPFDVTQAGLSYVGLDSLGKPKLTRLVSTSVLQRMAVYAADRTSGKVTDKKPRFLIVDEANFVARKVLLNLLSRARSAGIATIVCTQGPTDWEAREQGEPDLTSLVQNTNVAVIMSQGERTNAELCADIIGRVERSVITQQYREGELVESGSMSNVVDYLVSPDDLRSLEVGEAVIRVGKPHEWSRYAKIARRDPKTVYR